MLKIKKNYKHKKFVVKTSQMIKPFQMFSLHPSSTRARWAYQCRREQALIKEYLSLVNFFTVRMKRITMSNKTNIKIISINDPTP